MRSLKETDHKLVLGYINKLPCTKSVIQLDMQVNTHTQSHAHTQRCTEWGRLSLAPPPSGQVLTVGKSFHSFKPTNRIQIPAKLEKGYAGATISNILQLIETTKIPKKSCVSKNKL